MSNLPMNPVVEIFVNGSWIDITNDVRLSDADSGGGIKIKRGRANESPIAEPTELDFVLNNGASKVTSTLGQVGCYSQRNPNGPYYGLINRNQPVRVGLNRVTDAFARTGTNTWGATPSWTDRENKVQAGQTWGLTGTAANFDIAVSGNATIQAASGFQGATIGTYADAEVFTRVKISARTSEFGIVLRYFSATSYLTAHVTFGATDQIRLGMVASGGSSSSSADLPVNIIAGNWYKMRAQVVGGYMRAKIWTDAAVEPDWQVGRWPGTASMFTDNIMYGSVGLFAKDGTDLVTFSQVQIDQWRCYAEITKLPPRWDMSRADYWVPISARGVIQRYGQGRKELGSALLLHLQSYQSLSAMWHPLESDGGLALARNVIEKAPSAKMNNTSAVTPDLIGAQALPGVSGAVKLEGSDSYIRASAKSHSSSTEWTVLMVYKLDAALATTSKLFTLTSTGTAKRIDITLQTDNAVLVQLYDADGGLLDSGTGLMWNFADIPLGSWITATVLMSTFGSAVNWAFNYHWPGGTGFYTVAGTYTGSVGKFSTWSALSSTAIVNAGGLSVAQVFHYRGDLPFVTSAFALAAAAYAGETVRTRVLRHATESGIKFLYYGLNGSGAELMGAQLPAKRLDLWQDAADDVDGSLEESRYGPELVFRPRESLYWAMTTPISVNDLTAPLEPMPDDQAIRNSVTVSGQDGGSATSIQTVGPFNINEPEDDLDGVGLYDEDITLNLKDNDVQLQAAANHHRSKGTTVEPRFPSITFDLTSNNFDAVKTARVMSLDSGAIIALTVPEAQPDPSYQIIQATEETIDQYEWRIEATTAPGIHTRVGRIGNVSPASTRVEPAGQITAGAFTSGTSTTMSSARIDSTYGLWVPTSTDAGVTGFDIMVAGVRLRVTSISGASSPQTITVQQTPINGVIKAIPVGSPIKLYQDDEWRIGR